jgi:hypothetical protein
MKKKRGRLSFIVSFLVVGFWAVGSLIYLSMLWGPKPDIANPNLRVEIPTKLPTTELKPEATFWELHSWLSAEEAIALRQQQNVVNLAWIKDGAAYYSSTSSFSFEGASNVKWQRANTIGFESTLLEGTRNTFSYTGNEYTLNVFQPFMVDNSDYVFVFDSKGQLWVTSLKTIPEETLEAVRSKLPFRLAENSQLSLTFRR